MADNQAASKMFLAAAVVLGVLATVLAFFFIQKTAGEDNGPQVRIVVAARDLPANATLDPERDLKVENIPLKFAALASQCLDPDARLTYRGQRLNRRILASQPVLLADLSAIGSLDLKEPYRALTIPADAGLVIPGDYVQIMVTAPDYGAAQAGGAAASAANKVVPVSQGKPFRVLAVNGSLMRTRSQATAADQAANGASAKMVTLEVTPADAQAILSQISTSPTRNMLLICPPASPTAAAAPATGPSVGMGTNP